MWLSCRSGLMPSRTPNVTDQTGNDIMAHLRLLAVVGIGFVLSSCSQNAGPKDDAADEQMSVQFVDKMGGEATTDKRPSGGPITKVSFERNNRKLKDDD